MATPVLPLFSLRSAPVKWGHHPASLPGVLQGQEGSPQEGHAVIGDPRDVKTSGRVHAAPAGRVVTRRLRLNQPCAERRAAMRDACPLSPLMCVWREIGGRLSVVSVAPSLRGEDPRSTLSTLAAAEPPVVGIVGLGGTPGS